MTHPAPLILVDGSSYLYRAFFASQQADLRTAAGQRGSEPGRNSPRAAGPDDARRAAGAGAGSGAATGAGRLANAGAGEGRAAGDSAVGLSCASSGAGSGAGDDEKSLRRRKLNMRAEAG